ncbi:TIGR02206 family membrane protein [uncultured Agrococcus sp.]|uniref:YwaF family protein n=1 Tax=uncultured Agrococcus sp. TaxID=382258 RepID=UPI0025EF45C5|nr:TIGR02206 family membrane protein [uncultured Agrococcus sp.]
MTALAMVPGDRMPMYGIEHVSMLLALLVITVLAITWARRSGLTQRAKRTLAITGWLYLLLSIGWSIWDFLPANFTIDQSLPVHLSDVLRIITALALITRSPTLISITYYWGLTLNLQSLVTPDLNYITHPEIEFVSYWLFHTLALLAPLVLIFGFGFRPTWKSLAVAFGSLLLWAGASAVVNALTGANYGYLAHAPAGPSLLDVMGGWPFYLVVAGTMILVVWSLMTLPWTLLQRRNPAPMFGSRGIMRLADRQQTRLPGEPLRS